MAQYVKQFGGYIADVPKMYFKRCDGRVFVFDELTNASITPNVQYTEINAGWSLYPVAYVPGQSTFEAQITSGKFEAELFSMANGTEFVANANYKVPTHENVTPDANGEVQLGHVPVANSIYIAGMEQVASNVTLTSGKYKLKSTGADEDTLVFYMGDSTASTPIPPDIPTGTEAEVYYEYVEATAQEALINNQNSAIGEAIFEWPVYASSDDCTVQATIMGKVIMKVFRCRVTSAPGFDSSYKSANTFQFTLSVMDPKRNDEKAYSIGYYRNA